MQTTKLIGITGGIGAGKSYFAELLTNALADHHISTESLSADAFVASLYEHDKQWRALVRARLGTDDKHEVAKLLFVESNNLTDKLFIELHAVARFIDYLEDRRLQSTASFIVVEAPLLFEHNLKHLFALTINVCANTCERLDRVVARDGRTEDEVLNIMKGQLPEHIRSQLADIVVINKYPEDAFPKYVMSAIISNITELL